MRFAAYAIALFTALATTTTTTTALDLDMATAINLDTQCEAAFPKPIPDYKTKCRDKIIAFQKMKDNLDKELSKHKKKCPCHKECVHMRVIYV